MFENWSKQPDPDRLSYIDQSRINALVLLQHLDLVKDKDPDLYVGDFRRKLLKRSSRNMKKR